MMLTISVVSLKGALSNLIPPGAMSKMKPKSGDRARCLENERRPSGRFTMLTDVEDVSLTVKHDVSIVSIFDLQDIEDDGVGRKTLHECASSLWGIFISKRCFGTQKVLDKDCPTLRNPRESGLPYFDRK